MRSFRSFSFLRPANAIFVPGMYCEGMQLRRESGNDVATDTHLFGVLEVLEESLLVPSDTLVHVGSSVGEAICLAGLASENTTQVQSATSFSGSFAVRDVPVEVGADFVRLASTESVALSATGLEETGTLSSVT